MNSQQQSDSKRGNKRNRTFRLRTLLVAFAVLGVILTVGVRLTRYYRTISMWSAVQVGGELRWTHTVYWWNPECEIDISDGHVQDHHLAVLANHSSIVRLDLSNNSSITDRSLAHLCTLSGLLEINIHGTRITPTGVHQLQSAIPDVKLVAPNYRPHKPALIEQPNPNSRAIDF